MKNNEEAQARLSALRGIAGLLLDEYCIEKDEKVIAEIERSIKEVSDEITKLKNDLGIGG